MLCVPTGSAVAWAGGPGSTPRANKIEPMRCGAVAESVLCLPGGSAAGAACSVVVSKFGAGSALTDGGTWTILAVCCWPCGNAWATEVSNGRFSPRGSAFV